MLYRFARTVFSGLARVLWRLRVEGAERVPAHGAVVLAPSHRSALDAFFAGLITRRKVRFMAKQELWKVALLGKAVEQLGAFPVDRDAADRSALRNARACLDAGEPLVVFPEGTRRHGSAIDDLHDGAAYLASRDAVPLVPIGIGGSERIMEKGRRIPRLGRVVVVVGEPILPSPRDGSVPRSEVRALTEQLEAALQKVFEEAEAAASR